MTGSKICSKHLKPMENCINPELLATATNMKFKNEITSGLINKAFECVILGENYETFQDLLSIKGWLTVFRNDIIIEFTRSMSKQRKTFTLK